MLPTPHRHHSPSSRARSCRDASLPCSAAVQPAHPCTGVRRMRLTLSRFGPAATWVYRSSVGSTRCRISSKRLPATLHLPWFRCGRRLHGFRLSAGRIQDHARLKAQLHRGAEKYRAKPASVHFNATLRNGVFSKSLQFQCLSVQRQSSCGDKGAWITIGQLSQRSGVATSA